MVRTSKSTLLLTGYAELPSHTTSHHMYHIVACCIEIDPWSSVVMDIEFTLATNLGKRYLNSILIGYQLETELDIMIKNIKDRLSDGAMSSALVEALKNAYTQYIDNKERKKC